MSNKNMAFKMEDLKYNNGVFPRETLIEAINNRERIIPELLETIRFSTENIESLVEDDKYFAHIYAVYLLAQFREQRAFRPLLDLFSIPGEILLDFFGDFVHEGLARVLASVNDGSIDLLKTKLIEDENVHEYVRAAALKTLTILVLTGESHREETIEYFRELFDGKLKRETSYMWIALVVECLKLYPEELYEEIKKAYDDDLVERFFVNMEDVENAIKKGKEAVIADSKSDRLYSLIDDTIHELETWACFKRTEKKKKKQRDDIKASEVPPNLAASSVRKSRKIGRNEPCPCGSGKKYKKCCLNKA